MAGPYVITKHYGELMGLDARSNSITLKPTMASVLKNVQYHITPGGEILGCRKGNKAHAHLDKGKVGNPGLFIFQGTNELISIGGAAATGVIQKLVKTTVVLDYDDTRDAGNTNYEDLDLRIVTQSPDIRFQVLASDISQEFNLADIDCNTGFETSPELLSATKVTVDALTDMLLTITDSGATGFPTAFLDQVIEAVTTVAGAQKTITVNYWYPSDIEKRTFAFDGTKLPVYSAVVIPPNQTAEKAILFLAGGGSANLAKFDGDQLVRIGAPKPDNFSSVTTNGAGNVDTGTHEWICTIVTKDALGNRVESEPNDLTSLTVTSNKVSVSTILSGMSAAGYNDGYGLASSNQTGVTTINCLAAGGTAPTLKKGDTAYFLDRSTNLMAERSITAVTATSITIAGASVNVNNSDPISANVRIALYRTRVGGTSFLLTGEIAAKPAEYPFGKTLTNLVLTDNVADADLGPEYLFPIELHTSLGNINPKSIASHQGSLVVGGKDQTASSLGPGLVWYSDAAGPEIFPALNNFAVNPEHPGDISGLASVAGILYVFKPSSIDRVFGSLASDTFEVFPLSREVGCVAQGTIKTLQDGVLFLSKSSVFFLSGGKLDDVGIPIRDFLKTIEPTELSTAILDPKERRYIVRVTGEVIGDANTIISKTFAWDIDRNKWFEYTVGASTESSWDIGSGVFYDNQIWWEVVRSAGDKALLRQIPDRKPGNVNTPVALGNGPYTQVDHTQAIPWEVVTGFESLGEPDVLKRFLRSKFHGARQAVSTIPESATIRVRTRLDYDDTTHSDFNITLKTTTQSTSGQVNKAEVKLLPRKAESLAYQLTHATIYEMPRLAGWSTQISTPNRPKIGANEGK